MRLKLWINVCDLQITRYKKCCHLSHYTLLKIILLRMDIILVNNIIIIITKSSLNWWHYHIDSCITRAYIVAPIKS